MYVDPSKAQKCKNLLLLKAEWDKAIHLWGRVIHNKASKFWQKLTYIVNKLQFNEKGFLGSDICYTNYMFYSFLTNQLTSTTTIYLYGYIGYCTNLPYSNFKQLLPFKEICNIFLLCISTPNTSLFNKICFLNNTS